MLASMRKKFVFILLDGHGRSLKRITFYGRHFALLLTTLILIFGLTLSLIFFGRHDSQKASELAHLKAENLKLKNDIESIETTLPAVTNLMEQLDNTFLVLITKSNLGLKGEFATQDSVDPLRLTLQKENQVQWLDVDQLLAGQDVLSLQSRAKELLYSLGETIDYFRDAEHRLSYTPSLRPVFKGPLTSGFGRRIHPINGYLVMHKGLDIGGQTGDIVLAPADGVVIWAGYRGGYGKTVVLDHGYGLQTHYAHLDGYRVEVGQQVKRNQKIAEMGSTGRSTGPHLHYEVRRNGRPLDPLPFVLD
ncbi:MAG: hypothetical protein CMH60_06870 [Myxococcales bacterium]|mgnify:CR=1 FL=1|nr:hypothetical protein [Myxococcales bacterium]